MGMMKDYLLLVDARGWRDPPDRRLCDRHVCDTALKALVAANGGPGSCDYCCSSRPTATLQVLAERLGETLFHYYGHANNETTPWEGREGGFQGTVFDTRDVLDDRFAHAFDEDLWEDLANSFVDEVWAAKDYWMLAPHDRMRLSWEAFVETIKHERRYLFQELTEEEEGSDQIPIGKVLDEVGNAFLQADLVREISKGTRFYHVRLRNRRKKLKSARDLGTAPRGVPTQANRMSPPGIAMFYGAEDRATAFEETRAVGQHSMATSAAFVVDRDSMVVDLSELPPIPSEFDPDGWAAEASLIFLHDFVEDFSRPVVLDNAAHLEYVPTQVVTEYLRFGLPRKVGLPLAGVRYRSARRKRRGMHGALCRLDALPGSQ